LGRELVRVGRKAMRIQRKRKLRFGGVGNGAMGSKRSAECGKSSSSCRGHFLRDLTLFSSSSSSHALSSLFLSVFSYTSPILLFTPKKIKGKIGFCFTSHFLILILPIQKLLVFVYLL
jgi:hypothetical protein